jgi:AcrR family transcriptional regulator
LNRSARRLSTAQTPGLKPPARMAAEDRRRQIVEVAAQLFSQKGFRGTTTKEIALAAGVNEAIIFRHFATKSDLYAAIIDQKACADDVQALEAEVEGLMGRRDDRGLFEAIAHHILDFHDRDETFMRLLFYSALEGHELSDLFFRNHASKHFSDIADYVRRRVADGDFRPVDPMTAARAFIGMVVYHAQLKKLFPGSVRGLSNRRMAERLTDIFLSGTLAPRPVRRRRAKS